MPTYEYACKNCGQRLEVAQKFSDPALTECPKCQGTLRKVFSAPGIAFKGSGFYKNDSRNSASKSTPSAAPAGSSSSGDSQTADTRPAESKPADTTPAAKPADAKPASGGTAS